MDYDLCVIGGGINGSGIARDAAGRGLSVLLVEARDLASATSSASTKLVHGGLRYLEQYEFRLVRESLMEREVLLNAAPHIIWPMRFVLPHDKSLRPYWMINLGLKLYDTLGGRKRLKKSEAVHFKDHPFGEPLNDNYARGFSYADCWIEDSRMVALNALDARERGATVMTRTACTKIQADREGAAWDITLKNVASGDNFQIKAKHIVNAAGPWVRQLINDSALHHDSTPGLRLVKGSHIVVPRLYNGPQSYILQQPDKRIVFAIPYEHDYTLIGTTDKPFTGDAANVTIDEDEKVYLCEAINRSFKKKITPQDIVWSYSGVRSLLDDGEANASEITRDYKLYLDDHHGPAMLSIFGGKITTHRKLAEEVVDKLSTFYPGRKLKRWTAGVPVPGGDIKNADFERFLKELIARYDFIPHDLLRRYARAYGTRTGIFLHGVNNLDDLGAHYGDNVYEAEIAYLIQYEFALAPEDILWRRSKLGLHVGEDTKTNLAHALPGLITKLKNGEAPYAHASGY
jgi:glycerol-3-phosphate dehydrogenase